MTTSTIERLDVVGTVEALEDFTVPCDFEQRHDHGQPAAVWVIHLRPCCPGCPTAWLFCDGCTSWLKAYLRRNGHATCRRCGTRRPARDLVTGIERLDRPPPRAT